MKVYVTAISAIHIGEGGKIELEVMPVIVKSPSNDTSKLNDNLLAEAALKWKRLDGWGCHTVAKFREISRKQALIILNDLDEQDTL